jgi:hypothetical protein
VSGRTLGERPRRCAPVVGGVQSPMRPVAFRGWACRRAGGGGSLPYRSRRCASRAGRASRVLMFLAASW